MMLSIDAIIILSDDEFISPFRALFRFHYFDVYTMLLALLMPFQMKVALLLFCCFIVITRVAIEPLLMLMLPLFIFHFPVIISFHIFMPFIVSFHLRFVFLAY